MIRPTGGSPPKVGKGLVGLGHLMKSLPFFFHRRTFSLKAAIISSESFFHRLPFLPSPAFFIHLIAMPTRDPLLTS